MKILIIEDDDKIITTVSFAFQLGWPEVKIFSANWGQEGVEMVETESPDIVILDLGLPDINGLDVIRKIRTFSEVPIIVLTINNDETTVVQALELGANDYIYKSYLRQMELLARVKRLVITHNRKSDESTPIVLGPFFYDYYSRELKYDDKLINFRNIENSLFNELIINSPNVVSYARLAKVAWGEELTSSKECIKTHIKNLRKKIESNPNKPRIILTKTSSGYYLIKP